MPTIPDWRSETAPLNQLERSGFAWEFLRRNQDYRAGYDRVMRAADHQKPEVANAAADFAQHWGLVFRPGPKTPGKRGEGALAPGNCTDGRHSHTGARPVQ